MQIQYKTKYEQQAQNQLQNQLKIQYQNQYQVSTSNGKLNKIEKWIYMYIYFSIIYI